MLSSLLIFLFDVVVGNDDDGNHEPEHDLVIILMSVLEG